MKSKAFGASDSISDSACPSDTGETQRLCWLLCSFSHSSIHFYFFPTHLKTRLFLHLWAAEITMLNCGGKKNLYFCPNMLLSCSPCFLPEPAGVNRQRKQDKWNHTWSLRYWFLSDSRGREVEVSTDYVLPSVTDMINMTDRASGCILTKFQGFIKQTCESSVSKGSFVTCMVFVCLFVLDFYFLTNFTVVHSTLLCKCTLWHHKAVDRC